MLPVVSRHPICRLTLSLILLLSIHATPVQAADVVQLNIPGPAGSGAFGATVAVLPNGNIVVTDPDFDLPSIEAVGAVYLYDGQSLAAISRLTGAHAFDRVGSGGIVVLANGNFIVSSPAWNQDPGPTYRPVGAVTWGSAATGVDGQVSSANSLVGSTVGDALNQVIDPLPNGNYLVGSSYWDNGAIADAGAVTWGDGNTGVAGVIGPENSLVGDRPVGLVGRAGSVTILTNGNYVVHSMNWTAPGYGYGAVTWGDATIGVTGVITGANSLTAAAGSIGSLVRTLTNGNYVVISPSWTNGSATNAGAVTWGNGSTGITGTVSPGNSLVGTLSEQSVGSGSLVALPNGNYVVASPQWGFGMMYDHIGAVTWADGTIGITGAVTFTNSLVGDWAYDRAGSGGLKVLANGHYVVRTPDWHSTPGGNLGAVTWGSGSTGVTGTIGAANSLVGSTYGDYVGLEGVTALANGNYVVCSERWSNGSMLGVGAATWANGATGLVGPVSAANSLIGKEQGDWVCSGGVSPLTNGNYVVASTYWGPSSGTMQGAVTWRDGSESSPGVVDTDNSLVGSTINDQVGIGWVWPLANGHFVVSSPHWHDGNGANVGAATWGDGQHGIVGVVDATNSLIGGTAGDAVSYGGVVALTNGDYAVVSQQWSNGTMADAGAVTLGDGDAGTVGLVAATNSVIGSSVGDRVGLAEALAGGGVIVVSREWDNGSVVDGGAITIWNEVTATTAVGPIQRGASVVGIASGGGPGLVYAVYESRGWVVVGRPKDNTVTVWRVGNPITTLYLPSLRK